MLTDRYRHGDLIVIPVPGEPLTFGKVVFAHSIIGTRIKNDYYQMINRAKFLNIQEPIVIFDKLPNSGITYTKESYVRYPTKAEKILYAEANLKKIKRIRKAV